MSNEYKIRLGVDLDTSDIKTDINSKIDGKYKAKLGVDLKVSDVRDRVAKYNQNKNNPKVKLGVKLNTDDIKNQIDGLNLGNVGGSKGVSIPINTESLEKSLTEVKNVIVDIKKSLGSLDDSAGMNSLVASVDKIAKALDKAADESNGLLKSLNELSKKDFGVNIGLSMGGSNPIARQTAYGSKARSETLPQLKEQMNALVKHYNDIYKESADEFTALQKLVSGTKLGTGDFFQTFLYGKDSVASRMGSGSLSSQMQAYKQYIDMFKQAASLKGLDLDSVTSQFSKSADQLIQDAQDIQTGANEMKDGFEKIEKLFGGGGVDASSLSSVLEPIIQDLKKIGDFISRLDDNNSIDDLTLSFNNLAETLNRLMTSADKIKRIFDSGLVDIPVEHKLDDKSQEQTEQIVEQKRLEAQQAQETANVVVQAEEKKQQEFEETVIEASKAGDVFENMRKQLSNMNFSDSDIDSIIRDIEKLGIVIDRITLSDNGDGLNISIKGKNDLKEAVTYSMKLGDNMEELEVTNKTITHSFEKIANAAEKVRNKFKGASLDSNIIGSSGFDKEMVNVEAKANKLTKSSLALDVALEDLKNKFIELKAVMHSNSDEEIVAANKRYEESLKRVNNQLDINIQKEKESIANNKLRNDRDAFKNDIDTYLKKYSAAAEKYGDELLRLKARAESCNRVELDGLIGEFKQLDRAIEASGLKSQTFFDRIKTQIKRYSAYLSVAEVIMYTTQALKDMFDQVVVIDTAMTELKKVTDETDSTYNQFLSSAATRAKELGTTIDGLVESTADFARLGYEFKDAQGLAEVANIYAVVGDDIDSVETATQSLISTLTAFKDEAGNLTNSDFALSIVDKMNEVSNNFAISSGGIGEALQRSASSMMAANNSLDETIALITAANTIVQDPASVGTAFKTISMRIRGAKTELEEAGLETEGMVESTAKLREEIMALSGVDIMLNENEFKSTYQIMEELADKWQDLTDIQQASVTELIAGKRQGNIVSSLMENFDIADKALKTSLNSSGSAMAEHEKWQQSLESRLLKLKATWQSLAQSFMSSDFLKVLLDGVINLVEGLNKLIDTAGTLPTLLGVLSGGISIFKNKGFLTFDKEIQSVKLFGDTFSELGNKHSSVSDKINKYNSLNVTSQEKIRAKWAESSTSFGKYISGLNGAKASMSGYTASIVATTVKTIGLQIATTALNAAITMGVSFLISAGISALTKYINAEKELAEEVGEVTSKFKEQQGELVKNQSSFNAQAKRYGELSKGVNSLGENISLTASEYEEYSNIVDDIANQFPDLVQGFDSQGNAILNCAGDVDTLTEAYKNLIKEENNKVLDKGNDIFKDLENDLEGFSKYNTVGTSLGSTGHLKALDEVLNSGNVESAVANLSYDEQVLISELLEDNGYVRDVLGSGEKGYETYAEFIVRAIGDNKVKIKNAIKDSYDDINKFAEDANVFTEAYFSNAFLGDYAHFSDGMQNALTQVTSGLDTEFYERFLNEENPADALSDYFDSILKSFDSLDDKDKTKFEAVFNLKTQFNSGDISYGEYVKGIQNAGEIIDGLGLDEEIANQIKLSLNADKIEEDYNALTNRLVDISTKNLKELGHFSGASDALKMAAEDAKEFLDSLTASEYAVAIDLIMDSEVDFSEFNFDIDLLREYIEEQAKINDALSFTIDISAETEGIEALNSAMAESVSGAGLSSEAMGVLKSRYGELESEGYNLSAMFEETANGIHINKKAVNEFKEALASKKLTETQEHLSVLKTRYDELTEEIDNCTDAGERASLYRERQSIIDKINDLGTLAAQYEGLTSAYQAWQNAESAGQERDMYESILEGFENVGDEISRGWVDDGTIKFLELLTGKTDLVSKSGKELKEVYDDLDETIKNTSYSIRDFFTVDKDGNSTNTGVYNFLDAVGQLEEEAFKGLDVIKRDNNGNIIGFDFELVAEKDEKGNVIKNGDKVIAEALGISEELVQIMVRASDDAGFVVNLEGAYTQLADLKNEAETARDTLISLKKDGLESLNDVDVNFNLEATGMDLVAEQSKAVELLDKFKKDGKIDLEMEGAQEALDIAEYLTIKLDDLTEPKFMQIDTSEVEEDLREPIEKIQEIGDLCKEKHLVTLTGDTEDIDEVQAKIDTVAKEIEELKPEVKAQIGIDDDWDAETIASKIEKGEIEIPAELELDVQMSDDLKDMRLMMMNQLGLTSDDEVKLKVGYDIDESVVDVLEDDEKKIILKYIEENKDEFEKLTAEEKEATIKIIADGTDVEEWEAEEKEALVKYVVDDGDVEDWSPEEKKAFAKYLVDGGDVEGWSPEAKDAFVKYLVDGGDPESFDPEDKESWVVYKKDSTEPDNYKAEDQTPTVTYKKDSSEVDKYNPSNLTRTISFIASLILPDSVKNALKLIGITLADGTANIDGTAFADGTATKIKSGRAFKQGDWRTKKSETALTGELGQELVVTGNRWYTVGDNGAEFARIPKGSIVFNHKQTEELFKNGKVTSGGGRGRTLANGTAFAEGTAFSEGVGGGIEPTVTSYTVGNSPSDKSKDSEKEFKEVIDWIEVAIDRIEREIDRLDQKANNIYKSWSSRNSALKDQINEVGNEIELQNAAYNRYIQEANSVGLSESWAKKVRDGKVDIQTITDEDLKEKIDDYQNWYEKALDCKDTIRELEETESKLYVQRVENVAAQYEGILSVIEHEKNMIDEYISQSEANAQLISANYYKALISNENETIDELQEQKNKMLTELQAVMNSGTVTKGSEAWYNMINSIDEVTLSIAESQTQIKEYEQTIQQLSWETFDLLHEKISSVVEEADFLIELLSSDKLYNDNGQLTNSGSATMGLHGQNYNTYMYQADLVAKEIKRLEKEMTKDSYDTELEARYREMISLQQEYILSAQDSKEAIRDMVEEGINLELDALQELIDKKNEALDAEKDLYDYQKKVKEQTKEIASLEKQIASYGGDISEETKAKVQQLKLELSDAKEDLEETEWDKQLSDTQQMLDELYLTYEEILNTRLDNLDALVSDMITEINTDAYMISSTLSEKADSVGYTLTDSMTSIWDTNSTKINDVVTMYGQSFVSAQTTTNNTLSTINSNLQSMITQLNSIAKTNVKSASISSATNSKQASAKKETAKKTTTKANTSTASTIKVGGMVNAGSAQIYDYAGDTSGERQYYKNDPKYKVLKTNGNWIQVRWHKLSSGVTGWFKKGDVKAYETGARRIDSNQWAWTQEGNKQEFIIRPSDGAILTPVARNDSVLNANASSNIWNMANSPAQFIKDNLGLGEANMPNNSNVNNNVTQNFENVVFSMPNVHSYNELIMQMQKDKNFEKLILSMSIDKLAGKSSLAKNKSIR